jgi:hypothetical protein
VSASRTALLTLVLFACASSETRPDPRPDEPETNAPREVLASDDDVQFTRALADAVCHCVEQTEREVECVQELRARTRRQLPREDPRIARQLERAQTCIKLAQLAQDERKRTTLSKLLEALFR